MTALMEATGIKTRNKIIALKFCLHGYNEYLIARQLSPKWKSERCECLDEETFFIFFR